MKKTAFIINCSRGGTVDETALFKLLKERKIAGAGIDVFENEPPKNNPLLKLDNVILTPHIAGATAESKIKSLKICFDNFARVFRGETPINIVNS